MTDPIRAALDRLSAQLLPTLFGEGVSAAFLQAWTNEARAALAARPPADDDHDRAALEGLLKRVHLAATDPAAWLGLKQGERHPPAPAASTPLDLDALLSPEGAYERGTGQEDDAQLVSDPNAPEWWVPQYGCETLDNLLDRLRARILPYLRPPVAGIDVPGGDGDYGDVMDLCAAEGVAYRVGVPLLKRARQAWRQTERLHRLQQESRRFREPERTILCDILANGGLLPDPEGTRYGMPAPTPAPVADSIRAALERLIDRMMSERASSATVDAWAAEARAICAAMAAQPLASAPTPAQASEPVAWLWEYIGPDAYAKRCSPVARALHEMNPSNPPYPEHWRPIAPLYDLRQRAPAVVPVAAAERPWERQPGWLTPDGECWWCPKDGPVYWTMANPAMVYGGWIIPHWAIPTPQPLHGGEVE